MARTTDTEGDALTRTVRELLLRVRAFVDRRDSGHALGALAASISETETALLRFDVARGKRREIEAAAEGLIMGSALLVPEASRHASKRCGCSGCAWCVPDAIAAPGARCGAPRGPNTWPLCTPCLSEGKAL